MMNIALYNLTTTTKHGGVESLTWDMAHHLRARGHAVTILGGRGDVTRPYDVTVKRYPYIARETWGRTPLRKSLNLLKLLERLSMAACALPDLRRGGFDIIQIVKPYDLPVVARAKGGGAKVIYSSHGTDFFPGDVLYRRVIDGAFACSRYNATMVAAHFHIPIAVAYNGFDQTLFRPLAPDAALRARLAPDGAPLLLYVGRLMTFKGLDYLLDALALLAEESEVRSQESEVRPQESAAATQNAKRKTQNAKPPCLAEESEVRSQESGVRLQRSIAATQNAKRKTQNAKPPCLAVVGDGPHRAALERRAAQLGIADRVQFLGALPSAELPRYYAASDAFVIPSTDHETFCIAACEAMACARPVIGTRTGGIPEVVRDGETGLLVPPGDSTALAACIAALLGDAALRERLGQRGREWVLDMFTWDRVIERMIAAYTQALGA